MGSLVDFKLFEEFPIVEGFFEPAPGFFGDGFVWEAWVEEMLGDCFADVVGVA